MKNRSDAPKRKWLAKPFDGKTYPQWNTASTREAADIVAVIEMTGDTRNRSEAATQTGLVPLKILDFLFVLLGLFEGSERAQVPPLPCRLIFLARI
jgi:hypothetical protein